MKLINKINSKYLELLPDFSQEKTEKYTSLVLSLIALSVFALFAINPTLSTIAKLQKEIEDAGILSQRLEAKIADLASLQQAYKRLENDIPAVFESMPNSPLVPLIIGQIQSVAKDSSLRVIQIQNSETELFTEVDTNRKYNFYTFTITADGPYENILRFTENLINMQRIVNINIISIGKQTDTTGTLQLNLEGIAYYKK
jgi:Tfp pilus assembly protein PilO